MDGRKNGRRRKKKLRFFHFFLRFIVFRTYFKKKFLTKNFFGRTFFRSLQLYQCRTCIKSVAKILRIALRAKRIKAKLKNRIISTYPKKFGPLSWQTAEKSAAVFLKKCKIFETQFTAWRRPPIAMTYKYKIVRSIWFRFNGVFIFALSLKMTELRRSAVSALGPCISLCF